MTGQSDEYRELWARARAEARARNERFGSLHLLWAMADSAGPSARLLSDHGVTAQAVRMRGRDFRDEPATARRNASEVSALFHPPIPSVPRAVVAGPAPAATLPEPGRSRKEALRDPSAVPLDFDAVREIPSVLGNLREDGKSGHTS